MRGHSSYESHHLHEQQKSAQVKENKWPDAVPDPASEDGNQLHNKGSNNWAAAPAGDEQYEDSSMTGDGDEAEEEEGYDDDDEGHATDDDFDEDDEVHEHEDENGDGGENEPMYDTEEEMSDDVRSSDEDQPDTVAGSGSESESDTQNPKVDTEISKFLASFPGLEKHYKLVSKIGEGTFSSVYKAVDLLHHRYINDWDVDRIDESNWSSPPLKKKTFVGVDGRLKSYSKALTSVDSKKKYVAIKKIYVTSSPARIQNELELLKDLSGCENVVSLITAFRNMDQVIAVMPYFKHVDFRDYFRELDIPQIRLYFRPLFKALRHVHLLGILHRDIKPTNFLYDVSKGRGVLVDFGLAEREDTDGTCFCQPHQKTRRDARLPHHFVNPTGCYPKNDSRPARRANRAGTRGFRAPEVLFKCPAQTTKIDIWSAGVILLTFLAKRFPFFNSTDDIDAIIEIATIFGKTKMRTCAALHGATFEANLSTVTEKGFLLEKVILWATTRDSSQITEDERMAIEFLHKCLELDPVKRISAADALEHPFLSMENAANCSDEEVEFV